MTTPYGSAGQSPEPEPTGFPVSYPPATPIEPHQRRRHSGVLLTVVAVVLALVAGTGVWYFALRDAGSGGQASPREAATALFDNLAGGDLLALADTLDPVEARFLSDTGTDVVGQLKRIGLLSPDATLGDASPATITVTGITFDDAAREQPLPDLTIVKLTAGTITITPVAGASGGKQTDLMKELTDAIATASGSTGTGRGSALGGDLTAGGLGGAMTGGGAGEPTVVDIARLVNDNDGKPVRISTVQHDGRWYPSLFFTAADYWAQQNGSGPVTAGDAVAGAGAATPEAAVDAMVRAVLDQDASRVVELLPPDEMAAVHTYGRQIVQAANASAAATPAEFAADWATSDVTGGTLVSLRSLTFTANGESGTVEVDQPGGTVTVIDASGQRQTFDASTLSRLVGATDLASVHPNLPDFVSRMLRAALGIGIVTTQVDGQWYVSPLRTTTGVVTTLLSGVQQQDIRMLIELLKR